LGVEGVVFELLVAEEEEDEEADYGDYCDAADGAADYGADGGG
jgi:hypothetical protein